MATPGQSIENAMLSGWQQGRAHKQGLEDQQRQDTLQNLLQNATSPEDQQAAIRDAYAKDPSKVKEFVENIGRRLTGKQPQAALSPYATPQTNTTTGAFSNPDTGEQISSGTPQTVKGPAPKTQQEAFAGLAARGKMPAQQQQEQANTQAGWQANFNRQQAGPDLEAKVKAVNSSLDAAGITDPATRQRALQASLGVKQPTVYEQKMEDYNTAVQNGYKGSPNNFLAEEGAKGRAAGGPIKPQPTKIMMVGGKPMIMQFSPETQQYDKAIGEAPPTYA